MHKLAAGLHARLRGLLRGIAYDSADSPAAVLARLDAAIEGLRLGAMATVLVARLEETEAGMRLRWSSAGRLPPVVGRDGEQRVLGDGDTVVLYTDGLVERRDQVFDEDVEHLRRELAGLRERPVEELCDVLLARLLPERAEDDVALVAVRLRPR